VYRTKFALVAVVSTFVGIALIALAHWAAVVASAAWLRSWPVNDIGLGLFTTGLFGVLFHYVGQRDAEEEQVRRIREVITDDLASKPDGLVAMVSSETRDRIAENCFRLQFGDQDMAHGFYSDHRKQVIRMPDRLHEMDLSVALAPWQQGPQSGSGAMFVATVRAEYRLVPVRQVIRFACVSDIDEYRELLLDPSCARVHYFEPIAGLDGASEQAFQLVEIVVDDEPQIVRRTERPGAQVYTATLGSDAMAGERMVTLSYTYRVLVQQHGHLFHLDLSEPTKNLKVHFAYGNCGIRYVNVLDYMAISTQPGLSRLPASEPTPSIARRFDGWILPKAGVAFIWVLDREMATGRQQARPQTENDNS
jgi:hypothetical protein